jgi:hypothetical protein
VTASVAAAVLAALVASAGAAPFLQAAYTREKEQRTQAETQRARANSNLSTGILVLDSFLIKARNDSKATLETRAEVRDYYLPELVRFYETIILANQDDRSPESRRIVGQMHYGLGVCRTLTGDRRQAENDFLSAQKIQEQLAAEITDPTHRAIYAAELAITRIDLAELYKSLGRQNDEATVRQQIAAAHEAFPNRTDALQFALRVAQRFENLGRYAEARVWLGKVIDRLEELLRNGPDRPDVRSALATFVGTRALLWVREERHDQALKDWERRSQLTDAPLPTDVRLFRARSLAKQGEHIDAAVEVQAIAGTVELASGTMYNLACALAISVSAAQQDKRLRLTASEARAEQYAKGALTWLRKSRDAGFFRIPGNIEQLRKDADLDSLRTREDFKQFLAELEKTKLQGAPAETGPKQR